MSDILLYGHADSGHAHKVALALHLAGLPYKSKTIDIWAPRDSRPADFLAASPFAEVPVLRIDGGAYTQSACILLELAQRFGILGGDDPAQMTRARELMFWEANRIGMCLPQLAWAKTHPEDVPQGAVDWLAARYAVDVARFDMLLGDNMFFHGTKAGIADCCLFGYTQWHYKAGVEASPAMAEWLHRMRKLPAYRSAVQCFPAP